MEKNVFETSQKNPPSPQTPPKFAEVRLPFSKAPTATRFGAAKSANFPWLRGDFRGFLKFFEPPPPRPPKFGAKTNASFR